MSQTQIEIVAASFAHAEALSETLRAGDAMEIAALGFTPLEALDAVLCHSMHAETVLADGEVAAMRGYAAASLLGNTADVWTFTSHHAEHRKVTFLKESRAFVAELQTKFARLRALVALDYTRAVRWLQWLGFEDGEIEIHGGRKFMRVVKNGR